ncbi:unnamed protein product [Choristocarpus tenellus]
MLPTSKRTGIFLSSPTKGKMELIKASKWVMFEENLPPIDWLPSSSGLTSLQREWIEYFLTQEITETLDNFAGESIYFGGKHLMAYAQLCLVAEELSIRNDLVEICVDQVEAAFSQYISGNNGNPLVYDEVWGGLIGSDGLEEGAEGSDFFSVYYNDHHFHYGYLINAAAVLAKLRPAWATTSNQEWVYTLIRDVNTPSLVDPHFPMFRSFDWFSGHSWARGLLFSFDGKDQESTSEDVNFYYAMALWGRAVGNKNLDFLGRVQAGVTMRSIQRYFLMLDGSDVHPESFIPNKVTGVFFENKVDYTTWFGDNTDYNLPHTLQMQNIPVTAMTEYVRTSQFVSEEWNGILAEVLPSVEGVWATILLMSYATIQRNNAFKQLLSSSVDDGLLRAWALYWAGTRPNCEDYCIHDEVFLKWLSQCWSEPAAMISLEDASFALFLTGGFKTTFFYYVSETVKCVHFQVLQAPLYSQFKVPWVEELWHRPGQKRWSMTCCDSQALVTLPAVPPIPTNPTPAPTMNSDPTAYKDIVLPSTIEAEDFDNGGQGNGYNDINAQNIGQAYRPASGVDIEANNNGFNVGWIEAGEWLQYTVAVGIEGDYSVDFVVAGPAFDIPGSFKMVSGGDGCDLGTYDTDLTGEVQVLPTGGWSNFEDLTITGVSLEEGLLVLRLCMVTPGFNIDAMSFYL